jgi:hypothetical protein
MSPHLGIHLTALSGQHTGALSRVAPVESSQQVDFAALNRLVESAWGELIRPKPESIPVEDVAQFRDLVYGAGATSSNQMGISSVSESSSDTTLGGAFSPAYHNPSATPADRITTTLQHMRGLQCA